jgi:hypothetical protein
MQDPLFMDAGFVGRGSEEFMLIFNRVRISGTGVVRLIGVRSDKQVVKPSARWFEIDPQNSLEAGTNMDVLEMIAEMQTPTALETAPETLHRGEKSVFTPGSLMLQLDGDLEWEILACEILVYQ